MNTPKIDHRSQMDIFREIQETASAYLPEWNCEAENPDAGSGLAMVYARMYQDTLDHLDQVLTKNRIAFAQELGADARPASPARGIAAFGLSTGDFGGIPVAKGYPVFGNTDAQGNPLAYETTEAVYVTPAKLQTIICTDTLHDRILSCSMDQNIQALTLFDPEADNLQKHSFTLSIPDLGSIKGAASISLSFEPYRFAEETGQPSWLAEESVFTYSSGQEMIPFEKQSWENGSLVLYKGKDQPDFAADDTECHITCSYPDKYLHRALQVSDIRAAAESICCRPELIQTEAGPQSEDHFYPFGEEPALYSEMYLASDEALSKKGARVTLSFILGMEEHPFSLVEEETITEWKIFMKNSSFTPPKKYDVSIQQVTWEYYNGRGWSRLFADASYEDLFAGDDGSVNHKAVITFVCPDDAAAIELFSMKSRFIRVRVTRMANLYKVRGRYFTPLIQNPVFSYSYDTQGCLPLAIETENNLQSRKYRIPQLQADRCMTLLEGLAGKKNSIYLCFDHPFEQGPIRMYVKTAEKIGKAMPPLVCHCHTAEGEQELRLMDETSYFARSGMVSLFCNRKAIKTEKFGATGYWYSLEDSKGGYGELMKTGELPVIKGLYMNSVSIIAAAGSGAASNQPADTITTMGKSMGYLSSVKNPVATAGGVDAETREEVLARCALGLRHHDRAVTPSDFEALTREAVRDAHQVRCFSGRNAEGNKEAGHVTVVLAHDAFDGVKNQVFSYLKTRTAPGLIMKSALHIVEPHYVPINCQVEVTVGNYNQIFNVHQLVEKRLEEYLDPVKGNTDHQGWKIGTIPTEMQIYHLLQNTDGVEALKSVSITGPGERDICRITDPYILPENGSHSIVIGVKYAEQHQS